MNIEKIKLYHYPATRSARVKWVLHELIGDNFEVEVVPLYEGAQYKEDYLNKNPLHCVPTLELTQENGEVIRMLESGAMIALLADAFPDKKLAPVATEISPQRIDYLQMLHFGLTSMDMMLWQIRIHTHLLPIADRDSKTIDRYKDKFLNEVEPLLAARLRATEFICGNEFTGADCIIAHNIMWAKNYGLCEDKVFKKYLLRLAKRPAFRQAFSDAKEFSVEVPEGNNVASKFTG